MATKAKKKVHPMPPLGLRDRLIYTLGYLVIAAELLLWLCWFTVIPRSLALREAEAVACESHLSIFWCVPFFMSAWLSLMIPWVKLRENRYPFFGRRGVKYGPPAYPRTFPLFMKNKPQYWKSPRDTRFLRKTVIFVVALNLLTLLLLPLSIHGRDMLYDDGTVVEYSMFDQEEERYEPREAESVTLEIYWYTPRKSISGSYRLRVIFDYGRDSYFFFPGSFRDAWVEDLTAALDRFEPGVLHTIGAEHLDSFADRLSPKDYEKLYELFESIKE